MNVIRKIIFLTTLCGVVSGLCAQNISISTTKTSLVLSAPVGEELKYIYYGSKLSEADFRAINSAEKGNLSAYPVYGLNCPSETALAVQHSDGSMALRLEVVNVETSRQKDTDLTIISLKDKVYPFYVKVCYKAYQDVDIIETWTELSHQEKKKRDTQSVCFRLSAHPAGKCMVVSSLRSLGQ